jgi:hypothetical protein
MVTLHPRKPSNNQLEYAQYLLEHLQEAGEDTYEYWREFDQADTMEKMSQLISELKERWDEVKSGWGSG